ncbi:FixH family protein [Arcobacter sp.]|uniref:FixH family protein n=1 Tax=Arcobacter sp. TaxID=1872629 RepID=UPI003D14F76D
MKKRNFWPLLFIAIFGFTFSMIVWTIVSAVNTPVHEDKSFLSTYHNVDGDFNDIVASNEKFSDKYNIKIKINEKVFDKLLINDVFLSQRVIDDKSTHKDIFNKGSNSVKFELSDKNGLVVNNAKINFKVTRTTNSYSDIDINNNENGNYSFNFDLAKEGNWNITGTIDTNDGEKGYFYIKSNATSK